MSSFFSGKVVWITGASSGIGEALVHELAKQHAKIILSARNENALKKVAESSGLSFENFLVLPFDLANTSRINELAEAAIKKFSRIDMLINNGGMSQRSEALKTLPETERNLFEVNYFGHVALTKAVLPQMIKQGGGQITVISSIAGKFGFFLRSAYSAAKHALHGYFESLRMETEKQNIKVLIVCPGKINTQISLKAAVHDGSPYSRSELSHEKAMPAAACAKKILSAIERDKKEILIGGKEVLAVYVKRFFPTLFYSLIKKQSPH